MNKGEMKMRTDIRCDWGDAIGNILMSVYLVFLFMGVVFISQYTFAKDVVYGSTYEQVRITYGPSTIFRFPKAIKTIAGAGHLQIDPVNKGAYSSLSITPKFTNGTYEVTFFLADRTFVRTKILVNPKDPAADTFYDFKPRDSVDGAENENAVVLTEVDLLKAIYRGDDVPGYKVLKVSQSFLVKVANAQAELTRIYQGKPFNGYVFKVRNTSSRKNLELDVRHITVGDPSLAILSQSDEVVLFPKGKGVNETIVRVVTKNTASSRDVVLAMESETTDVKSKGGE